MLYAYTPPPLSFWAMHVGALAMNDVQEVGRQGVGRCLYSLNPGYYWDDTMHPFTEIHHFKVVCIQRVSEVEDDKFEHGVFTKLGPNVTS